MKKNLLSLIACGLVLSACTSEDVLNESIQSNAITFRNVINKNTRALDSGNFNKFFVFGYYTKGNDLNTRFNIFTDTPVSKTSDGWASAISRYWVDGANYSFYAFSCDNNDINQSYGGPSIDQYDGTFRINYTCHATDGNSHDLVFASSKQTGLKENNQPVTMQFKHILSKVSLKFQSDFPEGYQVEISDIIIKGFENMGTFTAGANGESEGSWSAVKYDSKTANEFKLATVGSNITSSDKDKDGNLILAPVESTACFMIPNTYDPVVGGDNPVQILFKIKLINPALAVGSQTIVSNTLTGSWHPKWVAGTQYVYTIHLSGNEAGLDQIKFDVGVSDWNNPNDNNKPEDIRVNLDYIITAASTEPEQQK